MKKGDLDRIVQIYPVLKDLPPDLLKSLQDQATPVRSPAGRPLFAEGGPCTHYPLVIEGTIRAMKRGPDGHEILLYRLYPGESCVITLAALLGETPYPAMAAAETDLVVHAVPRSLFLEMILRSAPFRVFVFQFLSDRMAHLMALIDDVAFRRVDQRLASRLLRHGKPLEITHQMLADELGTTREVVSRTLESFQEAGLLRLGRKRIEILDRKALERVYGVEAVREGAS